jgi:hypothetical protein
MTVGIIDAYLQQVCKLIHNWDSKKHTFKVREMHKLVGKLARLGKGAPWIFKLMSHLYTSLAYALKNNKKLLKSCSKDFRELINQIEQKHFFGKQTDLQRNVNFVMKRAAKIVNNFGHKYLINRTMREELEIISEALKPTSGIVFETPIAHLITQIPTASIIGDSSLLSCSGYLTTLKFWWHLLFPPEVVARMLLHLGTIQTKFSSQSTVLNM